MKFLVAVVLCGLATVVLSEHDSLHYVDDILDDSNYDLGDLIRNAIRGSLNRYLDQAEKLVSRRDDLRDTIGAKIQAIRQKIESTIDMPVDMAKDILSKAKRDISDLYNEILRGLNNRPSSGDNYAYDVDSELGEIFTEIRNMIRSPEAIAAIREYVRSLETNHPIIFLIKATTGRATDEDISEVLNELLSGLEYSLSSYGVDYSALGDLFKRAHELVKTDEGLAIFKKYFQDLHTTHPIASRVREFVVTAKDVELREVLDHLLSGLQYDGNYDATTQLRDLFVRVKQIIFASNQGLASLREYAHQKLVSTHPVIVLIKRYLQYSSDDDLKELFSEIFKNLGYFYGNYDESSGLKDLFLQIKDIVLGSDEGLNVVRVYAQNLETIHPIALRIRNFVVNADEDDLKEALEGLFEGLE